MASELRRMRALLSVESEDEEDGDCCEAGCTCDAGCDCDDDCPCEGLCAGAEDEAS
jgi:hypothetical protein